jgi:methylated-DNA-[protein]-cysteine S-methyltransferase
VGSALRNNPFAPYVPCHRVVASNLFVGGFFGEWGRDSKTGTQCDRKVEMLRREGVRFTPNGFLSGGEDVIWRG